MPVMLNTNPLTGEQQYIPTMSAQGIPATATIPGQGVAPDAAAAIQGATTPDGSPASPSTAPSYGTSYDPSNPQPYQDQGSIPGTSQPVSAASGLPPEQEIQHLGATSPMGAGAFVADKLFRGYLQGRAVADIRKAVQLQKTTQGLNSLYHNAAENLYNLAQAGVDPNSDQFKEAQNQAQSAWQAQVDFLGQHVQAMKTNKQGKQVPDQGNLLQRIFKPNDPSEVAPALYEAMQKTGPPVMHQIAPFLTPQYQAKVQQKAAIGGTSAATAQTVAQNQQTMAANKAEFDQLNSSTTPLTPDQEARKQQLYGAITMNPSTAAGAPNPGQKWLPVPGVKPYEKVAGSGQFFEAVRNPTNGQVMDRPMPIGFKPTPNAYTVGKEKWSRDASGKPYIALFDPQTNQELPGTQNYSRIPPANLVGRITSSTATDANGQTTTKSAMSAPVQSGNPAENVAATAAASSSPVSPQQSGHTGPVGATSTTPHAPGHLNRPTPAGPSQPLSDPVPTDGFPAYPKNPRVVSWAKDVSTGDTPLTSVPSSLRSDVVGYMSDNKIPIGQKDTVGEKNAIDSIKENIPVIAKAMKMLEPFKDEGGIEAGIKQRFGYGMYAKGFDKSALDTATNQLEGFIQLAGATQFAKLGRGKYIIEQAQRHLPNPSVDSPQEMYNKLHDLNDIFGQQLQSAADRQNRDVHSGEATGKRKDVTTQTYNPNSNWTPPAGLPDASKVPDTYIVRDKVTKQPIAVAKGGQWTQPTQ